LMEIMRKGKKLENSCLNIGLEAAFAATELAPQFRPRLEGRYFCIQLFKDLFCRAYFLR